MDKGKISFVLFLTLLVTVSTISYYEITDTLQILALFLIFFVFTYIWFDLTSRITPKLRITKESDEILHPVTQIENTLHAVNIQKHYGKEYNQKLLEKCSCGSTLFRIYNEDTEKGTYIQFICAKCNTKATGLEFNWKEQNKQ